jgi:hypothetical protein
MSQESHDLGPTPTLTTLAGFGDGYVCPGDEVYVVSEDCDYVYLNTGSNPPADGFNIIKAIFLPGVWQRRDSGGGAGALRYNTVAVGVLGSGRLIDADIVGLVDGTSLAWVESVKDTWRWDATSTATADNITVCNPTANGANPGRFIRKLEAAPEWMLQTEWCVSSTGNDENTGLDAANALLTTEERRRRMGISAQWQASTAYHLRYLSDGYSDLIEGYRGTNAVVYCHANTVNGVGASTLYSGTVDATDALNTATGQPYTITSNGIPVSWAASNLISVARLRLTSGTLAVSAADFQDTITPKKAWCDEFLLPVASLNAAPFVSPAATQAPPVVNDTFVVEAWRQMTRMHVNLKGSPGSATTSIGVVLDGLQVGSVSGGESCGIFHYNCRNATSFGKGSFYSFRCCVFAALSLNDISLKSIIGGHAVGSVVLVNEDPTNSTVSNFTLPAPTTILTFGGAGSQNSPDTWRPGQIGAHNHTTVTTPPFVIFCNGVRLGSGWIAYGLANTAPLFSIMHNSVLIAQNGTYSSTSGYQTSATNIMGVYNGVVFLSSAPAYDPATGLYTAPRLLSRANLEATVAAGGFNYIVSVPDGNANGATHY